MLRASWATSAALPAMAVVALLCLLIASAISSVSPWANPTDLCTDVLARAISATASCMLEILPATSNVAALVWMARCFTSYATTPKPAPALPARAASIVAFRASRWLCFAIAAISPTTASIWRALSLRAARAAALCCTRLTASAAASAASLLWRCTVTMLATRSCEAPATLCDIAEAFPAKVAAAVLSCSAIVATWLACTASTQIALATAITVSTDCCMRASKAPDKLFRVATRSAETCRCSSWDASFNTRSLSASFLNMSRRRLR